MLVGTFAQAQDGVDFGGHWILETPSSTSAETPQVLLVQQSLVTTNVRDERMRAFFKDIIIERQARSGSRTESHQIGVAGGTIVGLTSTGDAPDSRREHHAVTWEANTLVFESGRYTGQSRESGVWTERREVWSLDSDGRLQVVITTRGSSEAPRTVSVRYQRQ